MSAPCLGLLFYKFMYLEICPSFAHEHGFGDLYCEYKQKKTSLAQLMLALPRETLEMLLESFYPLYMMSPIEDDVIVVAEFARDALKLARALQKIALSPAKKDCKLNRRLNHLFPHLKQQHESALNYYVECYLSDFARTGTCNDAFSLLLLRLDPEAQHVFCTRLLPNPKRFQTGKKRI